MSKIIDEFVSAYKNSPSTQKAIAHAILGGGIGGLAFGGMSATQGGEDDLAKRKKRIIRDALIGAVGGAAVGGALPLGVAAVNAPPPPAARPDWITRNVWDPLATQAWRNKLTTTGVILSAVNTALRSGAAAPNAGEAVARAALKGKARDVFRAGVKASRRSRGARAAIPIILGFIGDRILAPSSSERGASGSSSAAPSAGPAGKVESTPK